MIAEMCRVAATKYSHAPKNDLSAGPPTNNIDKWRPINRISGGVADANPAQCAPAAWAKHSPFELKDELKRHGHCSSDGATADHGPGSSTLGAPKPQKYLQKTIYQRELKPRMQNLTAFDRFSCQDLWEQGLSISSDVPGPRRSIPSKNARTL